MTLPTVTITGTIDPPDNAVIGATVVFRLSAPDIDGNTGLAVPREVRAPVVDGAFSAAVWPVSRGVRDTHYAVSVHYPPASGSQPSVANYGAIRPSEHEPNWGLGELLRAINEPHPEYLTQAEYAAALGAAAAFYETIAAGVASVADGARFFAISGGGQVFSLWRRSGMQAVPVYLMVEDVA